LATTSVCGSNEIAGNAIAVDVTDRSAFKLEPHLGEITAYCYRMLGSVFDADDAAQETMLRAWRAAPTFQGRSATRWWLYKIATNVCIDALRGRTRREWPMALEPSSTVDEAMLRSPQTERRWLLPFPDARLDLIQDPEDVVVERDTIRLAFVAALQHLPARQRAVLLLRDVVRLRASEVAQMLETSVAAVNSAHQRARTTLANCDLGEPDARVLGAAERRLLAEYVDAFERYDLTALVSLLHADAVMSMPPYPMWLQGPRDVERWMLGPGGDCRGSRLLPTEANRRAAYGQYKPDDRGGFRPWALLVVEISGPAISSMHFFLDTRVFEAFGLPDHLASSANWRPGGAEVGVRKP
jgi:RNA polymerase sigma-70 factor (ECF subfamily)